MVEYEYRVQLPLPGGQFYDLCPCWEPRGVAAVVETLLAHCAQPPAEIRIVVAPRMEKGGQ
jgi:hypothetical protein